MRRFLTLLLCLTLAAGQLMAQTRTVKGKVADEKGAPVPNASVLVKGTTNGTKTNEDGTFTISVPANGKTLVVSSIGFANQELTIGSSNFIAIKLASADKALEDVVVTGYKTTRRDRLTGSASKIAGRQMEQVPMASFDQLLQGRAPGLYVASGSGQPGASARVVIRGVGSLSGGTQPLYVLDGVPIEESVFRTLNPNDFESYDILKDAATAGQYGARAANGVVVITTKKGASGPIRIQARTQLGISPVPQQLNLRLMNTEERLRYEEQFLGGANGVLGSTGLTGYPGWDYSPNNPRYQTLSASQRAAEALLLDSIRKINTNWADVMFRDAKFRQHEVSAQGGTENFNFFTSLSAFNQQGTLYRSNLDRYTFRANIDFRTERLNVSVRSFAGWSSQAGIESEAGVALANPVAAAFLELPYRQLRRADGQIDVGAGKTGPNAYDRAFTTTNTINQFKGNLAVTLQYKIWNGISFKTTNGVDWRNNNNSRFIDPNSFAGSQIALGNQGSYNESFSENLQLISTTGFVYNGNFKDGKHVINALAMYEAVRNKNRSFGATGFGINRVLLNTPAGITPGTATNNLIPQITGGKTINGLSSMFALLDYTFMGRYTFSASVRNDAFSQVPVANRGKDIYTSFGANWNIMKEKFMQNQNVIQDAIIRASYGESANGNGFTSNFGFISTYGASSTGYAGAAGIIPTSPGNADYKVETQILTNFGTDVTLLNRRLRVTLEYYIKNSRNLFADQPLSRTTGFTALATNAAAVRNTGLEFNISGDVVKNKDLTVTIGINGAFQKNVVTSLGTLTEIAAGTGITRVGLPLGTHFTVGWLGVDPATGAPIYSDLNGNPTSVYSAANSRSSFGTFNPNFLGGATLDVTWKGFQFSALFSTAQGIQRFNNEAFFYETTNSNIQFNKRVEMLNSWQKAGDVTNFQRINTQRQFSSRDIQDASFIRFRNLSVAYNLAIKNPRYGIKSVRIWAQGQNLLTWTKWNGFDPEESNNIASYEFPNPRTYTFGLDFNF